MAQRKEIKRLEKEAELREREERDEQERANEEERRRDLETFERNELGFEDGAGSTTTQGEKRKRHVAEELHVRRSDLDADTATSKKQKTSESSFWTPGSEATSRSSTSAAAAATKSRPKKIHPLCPASIPGSQHTYSLKSLIAAEFTYPDTESSDSNPPASDHEPTRICPSCKKALTNTSRAVLGTAERCGHVVCGTCADLFVNDGRGDGAQAAAEEVSGGSKTRLVSCFVCSADLGGVESVKAQEKGEEQSSGKKHKHNGAHNRPTGPRTGRLVEISCEGTGFAGGGANMTKREGVVFKC
jgi:nitric oxide synthase-interacting protein